MTQYKQNSIYILIIAFLLTALATNIKAQYIDSILISRINHWRDSLDHPILKLDPILNQAASVQAYYNASQKSLGHYQHTFQLETPQERVLFYSGKRTYVLEQASRMKISKFKRDSLNLNPAVDSIIQNWVKNAPQYDITTPILEHIGVSSVKGRDGNIYVIAVLSSPENSLPKQFNNSSLSWGVRPIEKTCKDEPQTYETMFFANSISQKGNDIYFDFHDVNFFRNIITNENDGLAIDVVLREQMPCGKENQFHPSEIFDGEMQQPIYKYEIYRNNEAENPGKIHIKIGTVPDYLQDQQWDANVIIINNNKLCDYSIPVEIPSAIIPLLPLHAYYKMDHDFRSLFVKPKVHIQDSVHIEVMYERSKKAFDAFDREAFDTFLSWGSYCQFANVECNASVEGASWYNETLLLERKNSIDHLLRSAYFDSSKYEITTQENWRMMQQQIINTPLHILKGKSKAGLKKHFKFNKSSLYDSLLFEQRKTHIYAKIDTVIDVTGVKEFKLATRYDSTISVNVLPWNIILKDQYILKDQIIETYIIDTLRKVTAYKTNLLGAASIGPTTKWLDSLVVEELVTDLDLKSPEELFNYAHFLTKYWFNNFAHSHSLKGVGITIEPEVLLGLISQLDTTRIAIQDLNTLHINTLLSGVHYYVAHNDWSHTESYINAITELALLNDLTPEEANELALFFNYFHKFKNAVKLLDKYHSASNITEEGAFTLAKTATLIRKKLELNTYYSYMNGAKQQNLNRYCYWLDDQFQIQRDEFLKKEFCEECK